MKKNQISRTRALTALLIGIMALPVFTQSFAGDNAVPTADIFALYHSIDEDGKLIQDVEDMQEKALEYKDVFRAQRKAYSKALIRCEERLKNGEDVICPEFNDISTYDIPVHLAAPIDDSTVNMHDWNDLSVKERTILRSYTRAGFCSRAAGIFLYDLCISILGEESEESVSPQGIQSDIQGLRSAKNKVGPATLKLRLQMIDEAISGSNSKRAAVRPTGWTEEMKQ